MALFPSGVTVVTSEIAGKAVGFTASAFSSVSAEPPLVLVCLAKSALSHAGFEQAEQWAINIVGIDQTEVALRFARSGTDKFAGGGFTRGAKGQLILSGATAALECRSFAKYDGGDHTILVGLVESVEFGGSTATVYAARGFNELVAIAKTPSIDWAMLNDGGTPSFGFS